MAPVPPTGQLMEPHTFTAEHHTMASANIALGHFVVRHHRHLLTDAYTASDARQDAYLGLLTAARGFDPSRGFTFATYATPCVKAAIQTGRGRAEGSGYRRSRRNNLPYRRPASLDSASAPKATAPHGATASRATTRSTARPAIA